MAYEFGTNWARFSDKTGAVIGPLMGYEVMTAFFLEAGFLGIMLFGRQRVGRGVYFVATLLVAIGTLISAFWILAANSWMQTPQGHTLTADGRFLPADWWQIVFNPSFPYRLVHMVIASYLSVAFVVGAVGAWHLRRDAQNQAARLMFSMAMWMAVVVAPIQILAGDQHGLNTLDHQPAKIAALEGDWETRPGTPLILFGMPDMANERTDWAVEIPHLGALILTHTWDGAIKGLKEFPPQDRPNSPVVFWAFRIMVGLGLLMAAVGVWAAWLRLRGRLYASPWLRRAVLAMAPSGLHRAAGRLDRHRGGTPAVHRLWPAAHRRQRVAGRAAGRRGVAGRLRRCVCDRVRRRLPLPAPPGAPAADGGRDRTRARRADPQRRHHAGRRAAGPAMMLTVIWAGLIAFAVLAYVLLDGFDLGVGILFAVERRDEDRDVMLNSIAPVWDGNETWLVFGGGGLFAMFPLAYAVIMPALYPAIIAMLLALVFRGVGFEFRFRAASERGRVWWDRAFCAGSTLAAFCQGLALGGLLQGIRVQDRAYAGGWWDWLTGFTVRVRDRRGGRVCVAGRVLADLALRRVVAAACAAVCAGVGGGDARVHRGRQPLDTAAQPGVRRALVRLAGDRADQSGADPGGAGRLAVLARSVATGSGLAAALRAGMVRAVLRGTGDQPVADDRAPARGPDRPASPSGMRPHRRRARRSCWLARWC